MAEDVPYISPEDLEAFLGVPLPVPVDLMTVIALDSACDAVRSFIGQRINRVNDDVIYIDGTGRDSFRLPERPVREIHEIQEDGSVVEPGTYPDHNWKYNPKTGVVSRVRNNKWAVGRHNIMVTYDHGYDVDQVPLDMVVPADLRLVTLVVARRVYKNVNDSASAGGVLKSESIGAYEYVLEDLPAEVSKAIFSAGALTEEEEGVLWKYRVLGVASGSKS